MEEVDQRILQIRKQLHEKVIKMPQSVEQQRKLIKALISLEVQQSGSTLNEKLRNTDPAWDAIDARSKYLEQTFKQTFEQFASKDAQGTDSRIASNSMFKLNIYDYFIFFSFVENKNRDISQTPNRVLFCEEICEIAASQLPDLWRLGQMYFTGELRGPNDPHPGDFKVGIYINMLHM